MSSSPVKVCAACRQATIRLHRVHPREADGRFAAVAAWWCGWCRQARPDDYCYAYQFYRLQRELEVSRASSSGTPVDGRDD